jgi:hypothetical protein
MKYIPNATSQFQSFFHGPNSQSIEYVLKCVHCCLKEFAVSVFHLSNSPNSDIELLTGKNQTLQREELVNTLSRTSSQQFHQVQIQIMSN